MVSVRHVDIYHFIHACQQSHAPRKEPEEVADFFYEN